ncbi:MAG: hypothetical protein PHV74_04855 [Dehalococcoidia bacterium]|nr:hypothetical protein [Dehalococcoidia bacterium]
MYWRDHLVDGLCIEKPSVREGREVVGDLRDWVIDRFFQDEDLSGQGGARMHLADLAIHQQEGSDLDIRDISKDAPDFKPPAVKTIKRREGSRVEL